MKILNLKFKLKNKPLTGRKFKTRSRVYVIVSEDKYTVCIAYADDYYRTGFIANSLYSKKDLFHLLDLKHFEWTD